MFNPRNRSNMPILQNDDKMLDILKKSNYLKP